MESGGLDDLLVAAQSVNYDETIGRGLLKNGDEDSARVAIEAEREQIRVCSAAFVDTPDGRLAAADAQGDVPDFWVEFCRDLLRRCARPNRNPGMIEQRQKNLVLEQINKPPPKAIHHATFRCLYSNRIPAAEAHVNECSF
jgi:hypothetical protein